MDDPQQINIVLPRTVSLILKLLAWIAAWSVYGWLWCIEQNAVYAQLPAIIQNARGFILIVITVIVLFISILDANPLLHDKYRVWLAMTPWQFGQPLPFGRLGPSLLSWIMFALCYGLTVFDLHWHAAWYPLAIALILAVMLSLFLQLNTWMSSCVLLLWPLLILTWGITGLQLVILAAILTIVCYNLRRRLSLFPFDIPNWQTADLAKEPTAKQLGYPYNALAPNAVTQATTTGDRIFYVLMATLWASLAWKILSPIEHDPDDENFFYSLWFMVILGFAIAKYMRYGAKIGWPISLAGRMATRRLIIPSFDSVWIGPLLLFVVGIKAYPFLSTLGLSHNLAGFITLLLFFTVFVFAPPSRERWMLTGRKSLLGFRTKTTQAQTQTQTQNPAEFKIFDYGNSGKWS